MKVWTKRDERGCKELVISCRVRTQCRHTVGWFSRPFKTDRETWGSLAEYFGVKHRRACGVLQSEKRAPAREQGQSPARPAAELDVWSPQPDGTGPQPMSKWPHYQQQHLFRTSNTRVLSHILLWGCQYNNEILVILKKTHFVFS